jgi:subtilisin
MASKKEALRRYIIMPSDGFQDAVLTAANFQPANAAVGVTARAASVVPAPKMRVLDTISENGPKLVEMPPESELSLRLSTPGLKIVPEVFYERLWERLEVLKRPAPRKTAAKKAKKKAKKGAKGVKKAAAPAAAATSFDVVVTDALDGKPVRGARIVAFTDFAARIGSEATTGANGRARLASIAPNRKLERVYVYAPAGYWGHFATQTTGAKLASLSLGRIDPRDPSLLLTQLYGSLPAMTGTGTTIAIIDSGVDGTHPDLTNVTGGLNCVGDETRNKPAALGNWRPALKKGEHGTHVAGLAAGRGTNSGFRGVAPGATLRSYRVFPDSGGNASNFDIAKAIDAAVTDKCDVINMSLGGGPKDDLTRAAVDRALAAGSIVIVAAGNGGRQPVAFPAAMPACVAVSAMGRVGSFPKSSIGAGDVAPPKGIPKTQDFVAAFSNFGTEIDTIGPGVEMVSTLPGTGHGAMGGTSMACPSVAGFAAHLLSTNPAIQQKVGGDRSRALKDLLYASCRPQGFGRDFEGFGLPS